MTTEILDKIAGQMRDAGRDPLGWQTALDSINNFVGGSGVTLLSVDERLKYAPASRDSEAMLDDYIREGWYANDPREACVPLLLERGLALDYQFQTKDEIESYHGRFLHKHNCKWFAGIGATVGSDLWCLAIQRSPNAGAFVSTDLPRLDAVRKMFSHAVQYASAMSQNWLQGAFGAFDIGGYAAFTIDLAGSVVDMNEGARSIIGSHVDRSGAIRASHIRSSLSFSQILQSSLNPHASKKAKRIAVKIADADYVLEINDLRGEAGFTFCKACALIRIIVPASNPTTELKSVYGLTDAELRVALALASGLDINEIAADFRVQPNTIRAHLKMAYAKTNSGSQVKLAALVTRLSRAR